MKRLDDRVAIITGASSGIGKTTAELFAQEGAAVVLLARRKALLERLAEDIGRKGGKSLPLPGDVTDPGYSEEVLKKTISTFGKVDVLVNNAGVSDGLRSVLNTTDEIWRNNIAVNQTAPFQFCREALGYMTKAGMGNIINVSSIGGVYSIAGAAYSSSKIALIGLTKNIAIQYAGTGIRCNAVCPGATKTAMLESKPEDMEMMEKVGQHVDKGAGIAESIDVANAILFFASEESKFINGQVLVIDNGGCL